MPAKAQDPAAARLFGEAGRLAKSGDSAAALAELDLLVTRFPNDRLTPRALLLTARIERSQGNAEAAGGTLEQLVSRHPHSSEAAEAMVLQAVLRAEAARSDQDLAEAQNFLRRVTLLFGRDTHPTLAARREAKVRSGEISLALGDPESAAAELITALEDEPRGSDTDRARLALARAWIAMGQWQAAAAMLEEAALKDSGGTVSSGVADRARTLLSLIHRRYLRPLSGQSHWLTSGRFPSSGLELREPSGVAASRDGRLLVLDTRLPLLVLLDGSGREVGRRELRDVDRLGWLADGRAFVVGPSGAVLPFDATSYAFSDPRRSTPLKNITAAAPGAFGDWLVAARGLKSLIHIPRGGSPREILAEQRPNVADLTQDVAGRVYLLDAKDPVVYRIGRGGVNEGVVFSGDFKKAAALAVDELGYFYVLDRGNKNVSLFSPEGTLLSRIGPELGGGITLRNPVDITVDGGGRIFIADTKLPFIVLLD